MITNKAKPLELFRTMPIANARRARAVHLFTTTALLLDAARRGSATGVFFELLFAGRTGKNKAFRQETLSGSNMNTDFPKYHAPVNVAHTTVSRPHDFIPYQPERHSLGSSLENAAPTRKRAD